MVIILVSHLFCHPARRVSTILATFLAQPLADPALVQESALDEIIFRRPAAWQLRIAQLPAGSHSHAYRTSLLVVSASY